jgi:ubiquinone/menaquinone biosynthesis C-methylase UbiE
VELADSHAEGFVSKYVHGYSARESCRLQDQANTLIDLLHHDTVYPAGDRVLEAGCGVGAQTVILAKNNPHAQIFSVDISRKSAEMARMRVFQEGFSNVRFGAGDLFCLPFKEETFDHVFVCFVLEHLGNPLAALEQLKKMIRKGGTITVIEGDHGSYYCHPETAEANLAVQCLIDVQARMKGNSLIGRQVYPLLTAAGFHEVNVSPRMVYVDASRPELVDGFTRKTFIAMVEGVRDQALAMNLIDEKTWEKGISDLYRTTRADGTFCYTFFKGVGVKK